MKQFTLSALLIIMSFTVASAQIPDSYYDGTEGLSGETLREELRSIITSGHQSNDYGDLYYYYESTDNAGGNKVFDMYSMDENGNADYYFYFNNNQECGNYGGEGDCFNREHSVPQSWFGSNYPMQADLFLVVPSDGYVNGQRSNLPYGETNSPSWTSTNGSKKGSCSYPGYSGTIFEPIDVFKGDFARAYFYIATRYKNELSEWSGDSFSGDNLSGWTADMLIEWHQADPVSQKEIDRNDAVYDIQGNANPYIDHPEWVECVWLNNCNTLAFTSSPITTAMENTNYTYNITYNDDENNERFTCTEKPAWLTFSKDESNNTGSLTGTPGTGDIGNHNVTLLLEENGETATQEFTINVSAYQNIVTVFDKDFEDQSLTSGGWSQQSVTGSQVWEVPAGLYGHNDSYCAKITGYDNSSYENEDWFISPEINPNDYTALTFSFWNTSGYQDNQSFEFNCYYTENYTGNVTTTSWTIINSITWHDGSTYWEWTNSGELDLSFLSGTAARIAFEYNSDNSNSSTWELDDILLEGEVAAERNDMTYNKLRAYPNPANEMIYIENLFIGEQLQIYNIMGTAIHTQN
ncbi:MAG: endonuclease, partial [Bacteroidota bacterium]|nr:endonuclease [Bacteroidota bacterium]